MRVIQQEGKLIAQFTMTWEVSYLAEQGERWVPFCPAGKTGAIGEIHAVSHEIRFFAGHPPAHRQAVTLCVPNTGKTT